MHDQIREKYLLLDNGKVSESPYAYDYVGKISRLVAITQIFATRLYSDITVRDKHNMSSFLSKQPLDLLQHHIGITLLAKFLVTKILAGNRKTRARIFIGLRVSIH